MSIRRFHDRRYLVEKQEAELLLTPLLVFKMPLLQGEMLIFSNILP
jgi:hypothetical protein